jgi:hypothetical protein
LQNDEIARVGGLAQSLTAVVRYQLWYSAGLSQWTDVQGVLEQLEHLRQQQEDVWHTNAEGRAGKAQHRVQPLLPFGEEGQTLLVA